jgi:hypothetical protein
MATARRAPTLHGDTGPDDEARLRRDTRGIEGLLAEAEALAPAEAWRRMEEAVRRLVELYGRGLVRAIGHARAAGVDGAAYDTRLAADELVSSLLVLHGVHPRTTEERIRAALAQLAVPLGAVARLAALDVDGVAYVRCGAGALSPEAAAEAIRRALTAVAPELARVAVRVDGAAATR